MEKSAALSLFAGWKGMPALYSGTDEKTLAEIREFGYTGVDLFGRSVSPGKPGGTGKVKEARSWDWSGHAGAAGQTGVISGGQRS